MIERAKRIDLILFLVTQIVVVIITHIVPPSNYILRIKFAEDVLLFLLTVIVCLLVRSLTSNVGRPSFQTESHERNLSVSNKCSFL